VSLSPQQWLQIVSVFLAAFLGVCTGIVLELFKTWRTSKKERVERQKREVAQINIAISGIGFNIETLLHAVSQYILPHHIDSHRAYAALHAAIGDPQKAAQFAATPFPITYRALVTTCPELHLIEWDFYKEAPFIVEKDPELLKQTGWLISQSRDLATAIKNRNSHILDAMRTTTTQGGLPLATLHTILHLQNSIADAECITSLQLFELLLDMDKKLEGINGAYKIKARKSKLAVAKEPLEAVMNQLREIVSQLDKPNSPITP
jgi:hypothetical protein